MITDAERQVVENGMQRFSGVSHYKLDVKGKEILIYTAAQNMGALQAILQTFPGAMDKRAEWKKS